MTAGTVLGRGCHRQQTLLQFQRPPWMKQKQTGHLVRYSVHVIMERASNVPCSFWLTNLERIERMVGIIIASNDNTTATTNMIDLLIQLVRA